MMFPTCPAGLGEEGAPRCGLPAEPERAARRPNTSPAYYLGHPGGLWITATRPRRQRIGARVR
jgi:hypothetical protein